MTVAAAAAKAGPYTGNDVTSSFSFAFKVFADADIRVVETLISTAVETTLVLSTNYTVSRNVDQDASPGGTITYKVGGVTTALPSTKKLTIVGDFDYEQPSDIPNGGAFQASVIELALDRATLLVKQLKEIVSRSLTLAVSASGSAELPVAEANKLIGWNSTADGFQNYAGSPSVSVSSAMAAVVQAATLAAGRTALGAGATGDAVFTAATAAAARTTLGAAALASNLFTGLQAEAEGAAVASAGTIDIWATDGNTRHITGATGPITSMGAAPQAGAWMKLIFDSTPTLTQSADLNLNGGGSDIVIEAGDIAFVYADTTTQLDVIVIRKSGAAIVDSSTYAGLIKRIIVRDEKSTGSGGGSASAATWNVRVLNTVVSNSITGASLASNQITLPAGTYEVHAHAPVYKVDAHKLRLRNITDSTTAIVGSTGNAGNGTICQDNGFITGGTFTIASAKVFELQHYTQTALATSGLGNGGGGGEVEVFAEILITKVA